jgi:hypothetical protein
MDWSAPFWVLCHFHASAGWQPALARPLSLPTLSWQDAPMWWMAAAGLGLVAGGYGLHRLALWAEGRGWIYYRTRRMPPGASGMAFMGVASILEPSLEHVIEEHRSQKVAAETDASGHPPMTPEGTLEMFGDFDPPEYEEEASRRWGDTDAYRESKRRTARYSKQDWHEIERESAEINAALLQLLKAGVPPESAQAMELAERHRAHISKWFYECTPEIHAGLGQMYVADHRFTENIDKAGPGLAQYMSEAIAANCRR